MTSINLLGIILIAISIGLIGYECQNNKWGYFSIVLSFIAGKILFS